MRKRLMAAVLITLLSFVPVFAGHSVAGGVYICDCDNPASHNTQNMSIESGNEDTQQDAISDLGLLFLVLTVLTLRYKG